MCGVGKGRAGGDRGKNFGAVPHQSLNSWQLNSDSDSRRALKGVKLLKMEQLVTTAFDRGTSYYRIPLVAALRASGFFS